MLAYRWSIERIEGFPRVGNLVNVVGVVYWELEVRDSEDHSIHYIRESTELDVNNANEDTFVDHLELDSETILGWVWDVVDKNLMEQRITKELNDLRNPPESSLTTLSMPWLANCCPDGTGMDRTPVVITNES